MHANIHLLRIIVLCYGNSQTVFIGVKLIFYGFDVLCSFDTVANKIFEELRISYTTKAYRISCERTIFMLLGIPKLDSQNAIVFQLSGNLSAHIFSLRREIS